MNFLRQHPLLQAFLVFILLLTFLSLLLRWVQGPQALSLDEGLIGVIEIAGPMMDPQLTLKQIKKMKEIPQVKGVVLSLNSPGGGVVVAQEIYDALNQLRKTKPVYSSMGTVAASGAYYVACATDQIFANPGTLTGSIGVLMEWINVKGLSEKVGIESRTLTSAKNKSMISVFKDLDPEKRQILQTMLEDTHEQFVDAVKQGRPNMKPADVEKLADGRIFTGKQAHAEGLVDELGSLQHVITKLGKQLGLSEPVPTLQWTPQQTEFLELLGLSDLSKYISSLIPNQTPNTNISLQYLLP